MSSEPSIPDTKVLAIASHVTYGYVGNKMATFVMQALGCDVSAINTVAFSNHTAYRKFKGRRTPADEIQEVYEGLKINELTGFDMMLSGYTGSRDAVLTIGGIGRDLKFRADLKPGSFFWILDPVMGDEGRLYVAEDIVPAYRSLLTDADLILPNCFEAELLSEVQITDMKSLVTAITKLHKKYLIPHIIVTSLRISPKTGRRYSDAEQLHVVGSSSTKDNAPRLWSITVPALPVFFSGTGDMFAALILARLRETIASTDPSLFGVKSWQSPDDVPATELPLAKATEKVLASMHSILRKTLAVRQEILGSLPAEEEEAIEEADGKDEAEKHRLHALRTRASEIRVVQSVNELKHPVMEQDGGKLRFVAEAVAEKGGYNG